MKTLFFIALFFTGTVVMFGQFFDPYADDVLDDTNPFDPIKITNCSQESSSYLTKYRLKETHIPTSITPQKTMKINVHVFNDDNGSGNWQNNSTDIAIIKYLFELANNIYQNNCSPSDPISGVNDLSNSYIKLEVENVYFYNESSLHTEYQSAPCFNYIETNFPERLNNLGYYLTEGTYPTPGVAGHVNNLGTTNFNEETYGMSYKTFSNYSPLGVWAVANHLAHEIGHVLSLRHTYSGGGASAICDQNNIDYLSDIFNFTVCPHDAGWNCDFNSSLNTCTNNLLGGTNTNCYYSPQQIGLMHRNLSMTNISKYIECDPNSVGNHVITADEIWDFESRSYNNIEIPYGVTLTITCVLHMSPNSKIIVKPGGKLIIDGGIITNARDRFWQGIELQGKSNESQYTSGAQGQVILKNGAIIENARTGITTIANSDDPHNYDFSTTGGIIKANGSTFSNCITGIHFLDYTNIHPTTGGEIPNVSYIKNCTFETTENIAGGGYPDAFIKMENVQWVKILGNTFQNTNPLADPDYLGEGINSIDAKYKVSSFCSNFTNPCTSEVKNQFINLRYGVRATATQSTFPITVEDAVFDKCHFGVYLGKVGFATIINNEFIVSDWFDPTSKKNKYGYGLYLAQSNDYRVEGNLFHSVNPRGWTGIYISNGNLKNYTAADEIYRNEFDNLYSAIVALNDNDGPDDYDGLTFHCNWFTNNTYDISVMPWTDTRTCVGKIQGTGFPSLWDPTYLVRNFYSADCIGNENRFLIDWNPQTPQDIQHTSYNGANWLPPSGCADYYVKMYGSPHVYNPSHCPDRTVVDPFIIEIELEQLARRKSELNEIIDGGQTALLVSIAQSALPEGQILQSMLEFSPYLSDEVLLALIERPIALPPGTMKQILSSNSPLSDKVFTAVQEMTPPLPNGILNQVSNLQTGELSDRDFIPLVEASYTQKQSLLISDLVRYYLNDTLTYNPIDSVIKILSDVQYKDAKINLVSAYIETKNFNKAQNLLDSLVFVEPDLDAFADKQELSIMKASQPGGVYTMLNDSVAIQILNTISSDTAKFGSLYAMNIIEAIGDSIYEELTLIPTPDMNNRNMLETPPATNSTNNAYLNCYPNPASEKINIEYSLYNDAESKFILMYNVKGQEIYREDLLDIEGVSTITVPETEGTYYIYIEADGVILAIDKIVIL